MKTFCIWTSAFIGLLAASAALLPASAASLLVEDGQKPTLTTGTGPQPYVIAQDEGETAAPDESDGSGGDDSTEEPDSGGSDSQEE